MEKQQQSNNKLSNYAESFNAFVGKDYAWPDWDEGVLGKPPLIVMPKFQNKEDVAEFNKVLSDISKMAHVDTANELRNQLKALAGKEINIKNLTGNEDLQRGPIGTPVTGEMHGVGSGLEHDYTGNKPEISFNPRAWGIYPVQGSKKDYGIATPEQMLIHELGHYAEMQKIYDDLMLKNSKSNVPIMADMNDKKAYHHAIDELHIVRDYENSAMASVDPGYKPRDADRYSDAKILLANENGYPDVKEQYRAMLIHSMQVSGRAVPDQLNAPTKLESSSSHNGNNQNANHIAASAILELHFSQLEKAGVPFSSLEVLRQHTSNIIDNNAKNNTLPTLAIQEKTLIQERDSEFS